MNARTLLLVALLCAAPAAWPESEPGPSQDAPNLKPVDETAIEGRALECQHCEAAMTSPADRHADMPESGQGTALGN